MVLFNIRSNKKAFIVNGRGKVKLKPNKSYISNLTNKSKDILKLLSKTNKFFNLYTRNYFIDVSNSLTKLLDNNKELLEYYYNLSREDIAFVARSMDEIEQKKIRF